MSKNKKRAGGNPANYAAIKATDAAWNRGKKKFTGKNKKDAKVACSHFRITKKGEAVPMYAEVDNQYVCRMCKAIIDPIPKNNDALDAAVRPYVNVLDQMAVYGAASAMGADVVNMACEQKMVVKKVTKRYKDMVSILRKYTEAKSKKRRRNSGAGTNKYGGWGSRY